MSSYAGPAAITDGLVFEYDMGNTQKSWKGAPITNLLTGTGTTNLGNGVFLSGGGTRTDLGNGKYRFDVTVARTFRMYCNLATLTNGQTYGCSLKFEENSCSFLSLDWCDTAVAGGVNSGAGITSGRLYGTATRGTYDATYRFLDINLGIGSVILSEAQVDSIPISTPYVNGTRSNTQAIVDLTGNNTVTANSLTYASDGTFSFNGISDYISLPAFNLSTDPIVTVSQWIKRSANFSGGGYWGLGGGSVNDGISSYTSVQNKIGWDLWGQTTFHTGQEYPLEQWVNVCWVKIGTTFTTSTLKVYINGTEFPLTTIVRNNSSVVSLRSSLTMGRIADNRNSYYAPGSIGLTQVFSRALSAEEVSQNFNAMRGRYGV